MHIWSALGEVKCHTGASSELRKRKQLCSACAGLIVPYPELALVLLEGVTELWAVSTGP